MKLLFLKNDESYLDMNNQSAQTLITYGERSILFMADMETPGQKAMIDRIGGGLLKCDVVKYPHHAKHDMYTPFYEAMDAKLAIVTSVEGRGDAGQLAIDELLDASQFFTISTWGMGGFFMARSYPRFDTSASSRRV